MTVRDIKEMQRVLTELLAENSSFFTNQVHGHARQQTVRDIGTLLDALSVVPEIKR